MIKSKFSSFIIQLKTPGVLLRYSINLLLSVGIFVFTYFRFKTLGLNPLEETAGYSEGGWLSLAVALAAAVPALFGRYLFSGFVLLGYVTGGNAERYYGSEYLPNLGGNTKAVFILAVFVSSAFGAAAELVIYFIRHRAVSAWDNLRALLQNRFFRAGIAFMLSFIALSAPVFSGNAWEIDKTILFCALFALFWFSGAFCAGVMTPLGFLLGGYAKSLLSLCEGPYTSNGMARLSFTVMAAILGILCDLVFYAQRRSVKKRAKKRLPE